ncbi:DHA2 family efflux MFS transporter permease subunit [Pseudokineococcus basanitobsidens]|uniref:DHA2 family efflux MFS transporter permease subunit n=1 Tax=Pseudokineococcus basanitobsidens TaxID=1926649 RepID=A0ABU8RKL4_9ACTN
MRERGGAPGGGPARERVAPQVLRVARVAIFTGLLATLDSTVVAVALATIGRDLGAGLGSAQWVVTGYLLALAVSLPVSGWLVERVGERRVFLLAVGTFALTSVACAAAWSLPVLVVLRVAQGVAGGLLVPLGQVIVTRVTPDAQLGRVMSLVGAPAALGPVLGPVLGGVITSAASWRWVFLVNVPVAVVALVVGARRLPREDPDRHRRPPSRRSPEQPVEAERLDVVGLALLSPGLALTTYALSTLGSTSSAGADPGGSTTSPGLRVAVAAAGLAALAAFAVWSLHRPRRGPRAALVDLRLLRRRPFGPAVLLALVSRVVGDGSVVLVALYLQQVRGAGPLGAGLLLIPQGVGAVLGLRWAGLLVDRRGPRTTAVVGSLLLAVATVPLVVAPALPTAALLGVLAVRGLGTTLVGLPPVAGAYQGMDRSRAPRATTTLNIAQRLGSPLGTALLVTVVTLPQGYLAPFSAAFAAALLASLALAGLSLLLPGRGR